MRHDNIGSETAEHPASIHRAAGMTIDLDALIQRIGPERHLHRRVFNSFVTTTPGILEAMHIAMQRGCAGTLGDQAHKLKSAARSLGVNDVADSCEAIETATREGQLASVDGLLSMLTERAERAIEDMQRYCAQSDRSLSCYTAEAPETALSVLVLDDDPVTLEVAKLNLLAMGITQVITLSSGEEALRLVSADVSAIDIILCDLKMPEMDGLKFLRLLSQSNFSNGIVLLSGAHEKLLRMSEHYASARGLNLIGSLTKPVETRDLRRCLSAYCKPPTDALPKVPATDRAPLTVEELRRGLENREIDVHLQPKIDVVNAAVTGFEALARWEHPTLGPISPGVFIPLAEEHGLIGELTEQVIEKSFAFSSQLVTWGRDLTISVNLSVDTLVSLDWPEYAMAQVVKAGINPANIVFEITECRSTTEVVDLLEVLTRLSLYGFGLSIDDYGTGYASMEQLLRGPFSELKVDRMFITGAETSPDTLAMLESSVALARRLGLKTVAEGVETLEQWEMIARLGCDQVQGFFCAKPMPIDRLQDWLENNAYSQAADWEVAAG